MSHHAAILVARQSFVTTYEGERVNVVKGKTHVREGHPLQTANPDLWEPVKVRFDLPPVETARQEPVAPVKKATAPKKAAASDGDDDQ